MFIGFLWILPSWNGEKPWRPDGMWVIYGDFDGNHWNDGPMKTQPF